MNIAVCVKQVPGTSQVEIDPETGTLKRDGVESKMNPFDLFAIESALVLKAAYGAHVTAVSMGPPQAQAVLREALMMGADAAVLLSDRKFGGADVLATGYALAGGLRAAGPFDLVICGKQTTDGDTAQVGSELAEFLGIPQIANVVEIGEFRDGKLAVAFDLPLHLADAEIELPALITVDKGICEPRLPSFKRKLQTADWPIRVLTLNDLADSDPARYGLNGSPTRVKRIFPPENSNEHELWEGDGAALAERLGDFLDEHKFLQKL